MVYWSAGAGEIMAIDGKTVRLGVRIGRLDYATEMEDYERGSHSVVEGVHQESAAAGTR